MTVQVEPNDDTPTGEAPPATAPVAVVTPSGFGDREIRLPKWDGALIDQFKLCRNGRHGPYAAWDAARGVWTVPTSVWACVRTALRGAGYVIEIRDPCADAAAAEPRAAAPTPPSSPTIVRFRESQARAQRGRDDRRWLEQPSALRASEVER